MSNAQGCQCGQVHGACATEFQYAVKLVCGEAVTTPGAVAPPVAPGVYRTAINIHNPDKCKDAHFRWKVAVALPNQQGTISPFQRPRVLSPDGAMEIDCAQVMQAFPPPPPKFVKGYVVIESDIELDVVAVYTGAQNATGPLTTFQTERVPPRCVPVCEDLVLPLHTGLEPWQTISPTVGPAVTLAPNSNWVVPPPLGSSWISQAASDATDAPANTTRSYQLCFQLCSGFTAPAQFQIQGLADNSAQVLLNGSSVGSLSGFSALTTLNVPLNLLRPGRNCFQVDVVNGPPVAANPTGFALAGILHVARGKCPCS